MFSRLDSGSSGLGLSPDWSHCAVVLARHFTLTVTFSIHEYRHVFHAVETEMSSISVRPLGQ